MSIASEITNYANGLSDAYDAVNDMQGLIPQDKNMNNLDSAIRTIPQSQGSTYTAGDGINITNDVISVKTGPGIFTANGFVSSAVFLIATANPANGTISFGDFDSTPYYGQDILQIVGSVRIGVTSGYDTGSVIGYYYNQNVAPEIIFTIAFTDFLYLVTMPTDSSSVGTYIKIPFASSFVGTDGQNAGTTGLVPAPTVADADKVLKGDGTWGTAGIEKISLWVSDKLEDLVQQGTSFYIYKDYGLLERATDTDFAEWTGENKNYLMVLHDKSSFDGTYVITGYMHDSSAYLWIFEYDGASDPKAYCIQQDTSDTYTIEAITISDFTGATSSTAGTHGLVPAPSAGDQNKALKGDGTWEDVSDKFIIMKYGESNAWAKFLAAYQSNAIVYCRASSSANPASGSQTRLAFMAYVNNETNPTNVEFQYVRSVSPKSSDQPVDQVFVYKLTNASGGTWSVESRNMAPKIVAGTGINVSYNNGTYTISLA